MFAEPPPKARRCRVLYVSPLKALAVDVERNLRAPLTGISQVAAARGDRFVAPAIAVRSGDTPAAERARFQREPADILITTPESLYLLLTSNAREALRSIDTVIVDEIHALVPTKRGAHLALSIERLAALCDRPLQRIGLSATQRPLDEVARFLGGVDPHGRARSPSPRPTASRPTAPTVAPHARSTAGIGRDGARRRIRHPARSGPLPPGHDRRRRREEGAEPDDRGPRRGHGEADHRRRHPERPRLRRRSAAVNLVGDPSTAARAHTRASIDAHLREQPPPGGTARRRAERAGGRDARPLAPRIDRPAATRRGRGPAQSGIASGAGGHVVARARHRHGRHRPGRPDRGAAVGGERPAAHRPRRTSGQRAQHRRHLPEVSRRSRRLRGGRQSHARRRGRGHPLSPQPSRHRRAADRGDDGDGRMGGGSAVRGHPVGRPVRRTEPHGVRRRARHALGAISIRRIRRAAAPRHVGPGRRHRRGA